MKKTILTLISILVFTSVSWAQNARSILGQALTAHGRAKVADITAAGLVARAGTSTATAITAFAKGSTEGRLENASGGSRSIFIFNNLRSWTGPSDAVLHPLHVHTAQRRVTLFPFLDLIADLDNPQLEIIDLGTQTIAGNPARHIALRVHDPNGAKRFLRIPQEEYAEFFIDAQTLLIVRSQRMRSTEEAIDLQVPSVLDFTDYRAVSGVAVPFHIVNTIGRADVGVSQTTTQWTKVSINAGLSDTLFSPR